MPSLEDIFGPPIVVYTADDAIEDGQLTTLPDVVSPMPGVPQFELGRVLVTVNVAAAAPAGDVVALVNRHQCGDWGDVCDDDKQANDADLKSGGRLVSAYETPHGRILIITEADRSTTTVMFPDEY